jgi:hypothetical protein
VPGAKSMTGLGGVPGKVRLEDSIVRAIDR